MIRLASLVIAVCACGQDVARDTGRTDDDEDVRPDASPTPVDDAGHPIADAPPTGVCDDAAQHADLGWLQANVFTPSCATAKCHSGSEPEVGLSLDAGESYPNLVGKGASTVTGWTRVVPGAIAQSYLVVALGRTPGPAPRDGFMPLGADPLCDGKLAAVERWIAAGALP